MRLGSKEGCKVSTNSPPLQTTLMRTVCRPGPLERSAVHRQLSTTRSGQFLLATESPTRVAATKQRQQHSPCMASGGGYSRSGGASALLRLGG